MTQYFNAKLDVRLTEQTKKKIQAYTDRYSHLWNSENDFVRSAIFFFIKSITDGTFKTEEEK
jgi:hypothetical protein